MKKVEELPSRLNFKRKKGKVIILCAFVLTLISGYFLYRWDHKQKVYDSIHLVLASSKTVEYGTNTYNPLDLIKKSTGNVRIISNTVDPSKVGHGEVVFEVQKEDVTKKISVKIMVNDTVSPETVLKNGEVTVYQGDSYNLYDNVASVHDLIDGNIPYLHENEVKEDTKNYYTISGSVNFNVLGEYPITVKASDKNGNIGQTTFTVKIIKRPVVYSNKAPVGDMNSLVSISQSLLGSPYVSGGNTPAGFDCSGFVSYVYSRIGIPITKSTYGQLSLGVSVARENMKPGDILVWSSNGGAPTHTGIYVGGGNMIHAANPRKGVIMSNIYSWPETLISIRRI